MSCNPLLIFGVAMKQDAWEQIFLRCLPSDYESIREADPLFEHILSAKVFDDLDPIRILNEHERAVTERLLPIPKSMLLFKEDFGSNSLSLMESKFKDALCERDGEREYFSTIKGVTYLKAFYRPFEEAAAAPIWGFRKALDSSNKKGVIGVALDEFLPDWAGQVLTGSNLVFRVRGFVYIPMQRQSNMNSDAFQFLSAVFKEHLDRQVRIEPVFASYCTGLAARERRSVKMDKSPEHLALHPFDELDELPCHMRFEITLQMPLKEVSKMNVHLTDSVFVTDIRMHVEWAGNTKQTPTAGLSELIALLEGAAI